MITKIDSSNIGTIKNPELRVYAQQFVDIMESFNDDIARFGVPLTTETYEDCFGQLAAQVKKSGCKVENDARSFHTGWISPSCITCRRGVGTKTYLTSTQCPRHCYFCFNPNQEDYEYYLSHVHPIVQELEDDYAHGIKLEDIALTGGEPLLHKQDCIAFYKRARELYPNAYMRLYTSGAYMDDQCMQDLRAAGLDEVRFSVKLDEPKGAQEVTFATMERALKVFPNVMVEMPVMPDEFEQMQELLLRLDSIGVKGINLLELCFPLNNAEEFNKRGYQLKNPLMRVYYNYWYAGGMPIAGSEETCLRLIEWGLSEGLKLGLHYCSLENKFTGQIYLNNVNFDIKGTVYALAKGDCFLKSAKVFGVDRNIARSILRGRGAGAQIVETDEYVEFPVRNIGLLKAQAPHMEIGISSTMAEHRDSEVVLMEHKLDVTTPATFSMLDI